MKKVSQITHVFTYCIILSITFFSCQSDELLDVENSENFQTASLQKQSAANLKAESISTLEVNPNLVLNDYTDCSSVCIEEGIETYYKKMGYVSESAGTNTKSVSYVAYNTETQFIVNVSYNITSGNSNAKSDITINIDGDEITYEDIPKGSTVSHVIDLPENWEACDEIPFNILETGLADNITFNESYALIGICNDCEESFSYKENDDKSYTFTYISPEDLNAAEVKLTCPHIISFESLDGKNYDVNPGNGKGSPTVLTWTGDIEACTEITFTLAFEADCEQNSGGFSNIFTDFKVNGMSKKGDSTNIKFECPSE